VFRRLIALVLLLAVSGSAAESLVGQLRDGEVHHETSVAAASHASHARGDHGHEDAGAPSHEHGGEHQHGTNADHCTHQHGTAVVTPAFIFHPLAHTIVTRPSEPRSM
jgi:hypothetical protein